MAAVVSDTALDIEILNVDAVNGKPYSRIALACSFLASATASGRAERLRQPPGHWTTIRTFDAGTLLGALVFLQVHPHIAHSCQGNCRRGAN
jgi:hypothetical protein